MKDIDASATAQYWFRILGALALIKLASTLVRDAERLISSNMKARNPEIAEDLEVPAVGVYRDVPESYEAPVVTDLNGDAPETRLAATADELEGIEHETEN